MNATRASRWPVLLCLFIAASSATAAFYESPLASRPAVKDALDRVASVVP